MTSSILVWLLFEAEGKVLLARRAQDGKPFAGQWILPGDLMSEDESHEETLERFARNVLSVQVGQQDFEETLYLSDSGRNFVTNIFRVLDYEGDVRLRREGAFVDMRWLEPHDLRDEQTYPMPTALRDLLADSVRRGPTGIPDNKTAWDLHSASYQLKHRMTTDVPRYGPRMPNEDNLRLLGDVRGKRLLDLGCGGGQCAIAFAKQGAIATGIDQSVMQLQYARDLAAQEGVHVDFLEGDFTTLPQIKAASQDIVFSAYALGYVEDIATCFAEVARVLKPGGVFVFSTDHPVRAMTSEEDRLRAGRPYWDTYEEWEPENGSGIWFRTWSRTIEEWFDLLRGASFAVDRILEPKMIADTGGEVWGSEAAYQQGIIIPTTIIFRAVKP